MITRMFFANYPTTLYNFGDEKSNTVIQDLSAYVDLIDQIKDNINFYEKYTLQEGERADVLSQKLYGTSAYYWTFYLLNDNLRQQGWPLTNQDIRAKAIADYPNTTLTTRDINTLFEHFVVGDNVVGSSSGAIGTVLRRNIDLGQIIVDGTGFTSNEVITESHQDTVFSVTLVGATEEYNGIHHYEDANKLYADIDPYNAPSASLTPITNIERYEAVNDDLKQINIIKPQSIAQVFAAYQEALRTV